MSSFRAISEDDLTLLEDYVLGELGPDAVADVERRIQADPELLQELCALQASLRLLPQALPTQEPPQELRDRILSNYSLRNQILTSETVQPSAPSRPESFQSRWQWPTFPWGALAAGAAVLFALVLGANNWQLRQALRGAEQLNAELAEQLDAELAAQNDPETVAALLQRPNSRLVTLQGETEETANAEGTLLFTPGQWQQVVVSLGDLPPLPPDQIYRMWLTLENDQVIFCGEFNTDESGNVFVTLEPDEEVPQGVKASGIFVTVESASAPIEPDGERVVAGTL